MLERNFSSRGAWCLIQSVVDWVPTSRVEPNYETEPGMEGLARHGSTALSNLRVA